MTHTPYYSDLQPLFEEAEKQLVDARSFVARLRDLLERTEARAHSYEKLLQIADELADPAARRSVDGLRGKEIAAAAVNALLRTERPYDPIHYNAWFRLTEQAGHRVGGADPVASFLTAIYRADEIEALGNRSGLYRLRPDEEATA